MPTNILKKTRNAWLEEKAKGIMATKVVLMPRKIAGPRYALVGACRKLRDPADLLAVHVMEVSIYDM